MTNKALVADKGLQQKLLCPFEYSSTKCSKFSDALIENMG